MKNKYFTRAAALMLSVFVAFGMLAVFVEKPEAAGKFKVDMNPLHVGQETYVGVYDSNDEVPYDSIAVTSVTSANKGIVKIKKHAYEGGADFTAVGVKKGKTKLTIQYKLADGTTNTLTSTVKVKAYPKQIKSLTVAGRNVKLKGKKRYEYSARYKKTAPVIKMKLKKGWKIDYVSASYWDPKADKEVEIKNAKKLIAKGKAFKFPKKYSNFSVWIIMTKGNDWVSYQIDLYR